MKSDKIVFEDARLCREPRPDDGVSPVELKRRRLQSRAKAKPNHRALQYPKAAGRAIDLALATECCAEPLDCLSLYQVELGSGGAVLNVTLFAENRDEADLATLAPLVQAMSGRLRSAVAATIQRSRTPELRLHLLPGGRKIRLLDRPEA